MRKIVYLTLGVALLLGPSFGAPAEEGGGYAATRGATLEAMIDSERTPGAAYLVVGETTRSGDPPGGGFLQIEASYNGGDLSVEGQKVSYAPDPRMEGGTFTFEGAATGGRCDGQTVRVSFTLAGEGPVTAQQGLEREADLATGSEAVAQEVRSRNAVLSGGQIESCLGSAELTRGGGTLFEGSAIDAFALNPDPGDREGESPGDRDAGDTPVASDGSVLPPVQVAGTMRPSFTGTGVPPAAAPAELPPPRPGLGQESIIGSDDRLQTTDTTWFPARAVVQITGTWFGTNQGYACTGALIGPDTVITAGHCVFDYYGTGQWGTSVTVTPGRNSSAADPTPFGTCGTTGPLRSVQGWFVDGNERYDYGAIKLNCQVGNQTGHFGFFTSSALWGFPTMVRGYPGDKAFGTMWRSTGAVWWATKRQYFYPNDTIGGTSGAPVYWGVQGCGKCFFAIHTSGLHGGFPHGSLNHGTRIRSGTFDNLVAWEAL